MKTISAAELKEKAKQLRKTAVTMIYEAQSGHPGGLYLSQISWQTFTSER